MIYGDTHTSPRTGAIWAELDIALMATYTHEAYGTMGISAVALDTGHESQHVIEFVRPRLRRRYYAIKGKEDTHGVRRPIWPPNGKQVAKKGVVPLYMVGIDSCKEHIYGRLRNVTKYGPGYMHFPLERDSTYFRQLLSERKQSKVTGGRVVTRWVKPSHMNNEALDCNVYAYAALKGWLSERNTLQGTLDALQGARQADKAARAAQNSAIRQSFLGGRNARR